MKQLNWYYPEDLSEAARLIRDGDKAPHSGGTALIRRGFRGIQGVVDLSRLPMGNIRIEKNQIEIGAMCTYQDIVRVVGGFDTRHVLVQSLAHSASTPLRNRITAGGSVAAFPAWSDFIGPLLLLNARVELVGRQSGVFPLNEYLTRRELRAGSLITRILADNFPHLGLHYRETRTQVDYPAFTITLTAGRNPDVFEDVRIVVVGGKERFNRLSQLEDALNGTAVSSFDFQSVSRNFPVVFPDRKHGSSDYLAHSAQIALQDMLSRLQGRIK